VLRAAFVAVAYSAHGAAAEKTAAQAAEDGVQAMAVGADLRRPQAGIVRAGLDPDDVILALAGLWEIDPATDWKARARTLYDLVFTGLKA